MDDTISRAAVLRILYRKLSNGFRDYNGDWNEPTINSRGGFRAVVNYRNQTKKMVMDFTRLIWYKTDGGWMSHVGTVNIGLHGDTQLYC